MTPQESEALKQFLQQLVAAQAGTKDTDAERQIQLASARQPDALYLLVQRAMIQDQAIAQAQSQIASLQAQVHGLQEQTKTSFLNSGWGNSSRVSAGHASLNTEMAQGFSSAPVATYPPATSWQAPQGGGSWLGTMAATAAGVAAGAFLFQGLGNLIGGSHASSQTASQLNNGAQSDLLPGYFEQNPGTAQTAFDGAALTNQGSDAGDFSGADDFDLA